MLSTYYLVKLFNKATSRRRKKILEDGKETSAGTGEQDNNINRCRICLQNGIIPIYNDQEPNIPVEIRKFGDIELSEDDEYPKFICHTCHQLLEAAILFRTTALKSDLCLRNIRARKGKFLSNSLDLDDTKRTVDEKAQSSALVLQNLFSAVGSENEISGDDSKLLKDTKNKMKLNKVQCRICFKIITKSYYKDHFALHNDTVAKYVCDICGKSFRQKCSYRSHYFTHSSDFPFKCMFCSYRGSHSALLKMHMRTHTGDYKFMCTECPARFLTKSNLNKHILRHKEPMFKCNTCQRGFHSKLILERHFEANHLGIKNHICDMCGKAFGYRKAMMRHQLDVHKREKKLNGRTPAYIEAELKKNNMILIPI